ncbi:RimJ/RimL family protein N-acetyltransferase [Myroides indicus]|uniref:RimJ/RimL family protein N-acetyltransferase n=2 Tax=Myroides indicus TaxID=1323422 RepID=A0A4R7EUM1_9FLAO|nr:RimJ/RimL family protein N-acetyltransferase [Myroides indicus]
MECSLEISIFIADIEPFSVKLKFLDQNLFIMENNSILLMKTHLEDIAEIIRLENEDENKSCILPYTREQHMAAIEDENMAHVSVWDKSSGKITGFIILCGITNPNKSLEFRRIVISEKGKGIGRQCIRLIKEYCFISLRFNKLWLDVFQDNERASNLYKSEGFCLDGILRDEIKTDDGYRSLLLMSILESEYS